MAFHLVHPGAAMASMPDTRQNADLRVRIETDWLGVRHRSTEQMLGGHLADRALDGTRDIHEMILSAAASTATESPGSNAAGQPSHRRS